MSLPSKYRWKFYLLVAHLTDEHNHTACNRQLPRIDDPTGEVDEKYKCETCKKYALREGSGSK
jgi:hypothetical protein